MTRLDDDGTPTRGILDDGVRNYLRQFRPDADDLLLEIEDYADEHDVPIASREVARFQTVLARGAGVERVLEVGTAVGYTTIQVARAGCDVVTLENDERRIEKARGYIRRAGVEESIDIVEGDALETLPELDGGFDMAFVDARKEDYVEYLDLVLPLLDESGLVVVDNLLWYGQVAHGPVNESYRESTEAIREFNRYFTQHDGVESVILPLGDGTGFGVKTGE